MILSTVKNLLQLMNASRKVWLIPVVLFLIIIALIVVAAQISPVPVFLYPLI